MSAIDEAIASLVESLNRIEVREHAKRGYTHPADDWYVSPRSKYIALDVGRSGAFLVEKATGEIYNIKAYGVPDRNKKIKANLGNVLTADPEYIHARRVQTFT